MSTMLGFLRPSPLPQLATLRYFARRISQNAAAPKEDPNLLASLADPHKSYPPRDLRSQPRPKISRASHRTNQPTRIKDYPDKKPARKLLTPAEPLPDSKCSPNLPYYVTRTPSNELPVYHLSKRGGNKLQTRVKGIDGNSEALRDALQQALELKKGDCVVNSLTRHVIVPGHVKHKVADFLVARKF